MWWYAIITPIKGHRSFWGLTNQRASCIAWQLRLTIHNFRLLTKAPRTLMTKLPSNYLLKLRPLHLVLCVFGHVLPKGARGWITSSGSRSTKILPSATKPVTTFSTRPCPVLFYKTFHPSPNNRLSNSAPYGRIKTKRNHSAKQLPQQWFHHNWQGSRGHSRYHEGGCEAEDHQTSFTSVYLRGARWGVVNSPVVRWFSGCLVGRRRDGCIRTIDPCMKSFWSEA